MKIILHLGVILKRLHFFVEIIYAPRRLGCWNFFSKLVIIQYSHRVLVNHQLRDNIIVVLTIYNILLNCYCPAMQLTVYFLCSKFDFKHTTTTVLTLYNTLRLEILPCTPWICLIIGALFIPITMYSLIFYVE